MKFQMNKVINGKLYNTETAQLLIEVEDDQTILGGSCLYTTLYRKRTGEYFLCSFDDWSETQKIQPLPTLAEAMAWAEEHLDGDQYQEIFGDTEERAENEEELNQQVSILLPVSMYEALKAKKATTGTNVSALIKHYVAQGLNKERS